MSRFVVGDIVRFISESQCAPLDGRIGKVVAMHGDHADVEFPGYVGAVRGIPRPQLVSVYNLKAQDIGRPYRDAVFAVDPGASNISGLVHCLFRSLDTIRYEAEVAGQGTAFINRHPVVVLFVAQMAQLCGCEEDRKLGEALYACRAKVAEMDTIAKGADHVESDE